MTDPKPPTHNAAREIVRNAELYTLSTERLGELLAYIAAAQQTERERDELKARARIDTLGAPVCQVCCGEGTADAQADADPCEQCNGFGTILPKLNKRTEEELKRKEACWHSAKEENARLARELHESTAANERLLQVAVEAIRLVHGSELGDHYSHEPCGECSLGGAGAIREALTAALGVGYTKLVWGNDMNADWDALREAAAKAVEEALTSPSPPTAPAPPNSSTGSRVPE